MKKLIPMTILLVTFSLPLSAARLSWKIDKSERIEMVKTAVVKYAVNRKVQKVYEERNIIDLTCVEQFAESCRVDGAFTVFMRDSGESVFRQRERFAVDFNIVPTGRFIVKRTDYMPNLRHIPEFPLREIKENDRWTADGELVIRDFSKPFKLTFPVEYAWVKTIRQDGNEIAVINYTYIIDLDLSKGKNPPDFPVRIAGRNDGVLYWDLTHNKPGDMRDLYYVAFLFAGKGGGQTLIEFSMDINTTSKSYVNYTDEDKDRDRDELKTKLPEGTQVDSEDRGIVLRMDDVLFDFDSYTLRPDTAEKLEKISGIIKEKYPDREIIVEGHTDNTGKRDYNHTLSEKRARTVSEFLKGRVGHDKISYRGLGQNMPLTDNSTPEGRRKNRRVEIIIKLN